MLPKAVRVTVKQVSTQPIDRDLQHEFDVLRRLLVGNDDISNHA
jgi:hypothetical protein